MEIDERTARAKFDIPIDSIIVKTQDVKVGDLVVFSWPSMNYVVEEVEYTRTGRVVHRHSGTSWSSYNPDELLWISCPRDGRNAV